MSSDNGRFGRQKVPFHQRLFSSLGNPVYRRYYFGILGQRTAMSMGVIARPLLAYRLTGSATILGVIALANGLPWLLFSLFGGVIADRFPKKYILLAGISSSAIVSLGVALSLASGYMSPERTGSWWVLIVASVFQGTIMGLMLPSRQAIIREIVRPEQLMNAVALDALGMNTLRFLGPALTGFLIDAFSFEFIYFARAGVNLLGAAVIAFMPLTGAIAAGKSSFRNGINQVLGTNFFRDIGRVLKYIRHETTLFFILFLVLFIVLLSMPYSHLMPIFTDDILKVGATGMGVLMSTSGLGAIVGSLALASMPNKRRGFMLLASGIVLGLALVGFAFSRSWYLSLVLIAFVGLGQASRMTLSNTLLQHYVEDEYRGRVMSLYTMELALSSFGTFFAGLLAEVIGVQWAIGGFAMVLILLAVLAMALVPRLRHLN